MKTKRSVTILALALTLIMGLTVSASAETYTVTGNCYFNGSQIVCDFESDVVVETVRDLQPGDEVTFKVKYENKYKETTHWYMRNEVLASLEASFDRTQNGGYTYKLTDIGPDGTETVLFDNSTVGGDAKDFGSKRMEGLNQATNALDDWFFINTLEQGDTGYTELYVKFDGETEVNDYMDTAGELLVAYAVELDQTGTTTVTKTSGINTGDTVNMLRYIAIMAAALLMLIITFISYRKDRRAAAGKERD